MIWWALGDGRTWNDLPCMLTEDVVRSAPRDSASPTRDVVFSLTGAGMATGEHSGLATHATDTLMLIKTRTEPSQCRVVPVTRTLVTPRQTVPGGLW
jgi:hypothetical protein